MEAPPEAVRPVMYLSPRARAVWVGIVVAGATAIAIINGAVVTLALREPSNWTFAPSIMALALVAAVLIVLAPIIEMTAVPSAVAAWAWRCRRNLGVLPEPRLRWSSAWAACGWFVPIASLVIPLLSLREIWSASAGRRPPRLLLPWWILWVTRALPLPFVILGTADRWPVTVELTVTALYVAVAVLSGVGAFLVVLRLTRLQELRLRPLREGAAPAPTWSRAPKPARAIAAIAIVAIVSATLGGGVMLAANTVSLALGSAGLLFGPRELVLAWAAGLATFVVFAVLIGLIATALWSGRTYRNLPALEGANPAWSPGWAVAAWFIPTANLALPYLVVRDTWPRRRRALLRLWWATWLASLALGIASNVLHASRPDGTQVAGDITGMAGDLALLPAGTLAVVIILTITQHQIRMTRSPDLQSPARATS